MKFLSIGAHSFATLIVGFGFAATAGIIATSSSAHAAETEKLLWEKGKGFVETDGECRLYSRSEIPFRMVKPGAKGNEVLHRRDGNLLLPFGSIVKIGARSSRKYMKAEAMTIAPSSGSEPATAERTDVGYVAQHMLTDLGDSAIEITPDAPDLKIGKTGFQLAGSVWQPTLEDDDFLVARCGSDSRREYLIFSVFVPQRDEPIAEVAIPMDDFSLFQSARGLTVNQAEAQLDARDDRPVAVKAESTSVKADLSRSSENEGETADDSCELCGKFPIRAFENAGVPRKALMEAMKFYESHETRVHNHDFMAINDFTVPSGKKRMYVLNLRSGEVQKYYASHGKGSNGAGGRTARLSSRNGGKATPPGFLFTSYYVSPKHGPTLLLHGMEASNRNSASRYIEIHAAWYASASFVRAHGRTGSSWGCVAVDPAVIRGLIAKLDRGALIFNYGG